MMRLDWDSPIAKPLAGLVAVVLVAISAGACATSCYRNKAIQAEAQANVSKGEADAAKAQAQAKDAEIAAKDSRLAEARADVSRATSALAKLRASYASAPASAPMGAALPTQPVLPGVDDLAPLVRKQDDVIQSQAVLIRELDTRVFEMTASRDLWKASAEARERETVGLRIALEAQKSLTKSAVWKGRIQGLALGLSVGYAGGRIQ